MALAFLIYFVVFQQACQTTSFLAAGFCDQLSPDANCQKDMLVDFFEDPLEAPEGFEGEPRRTERREREPVIPRCRFNYNVSLGKVDILFVIDNSSSMFDEQENLASQFKSFLKDIKNVDYNIAVITTDTSPTSKGIKDAAYQDGKFILINGQLFLSNPEVGENPDKSLISAFTEAIKREETFECDNSAKEASAEGGTNTNRPDKYRNLQQPVESGDSCPNYDERGTYALNLAFQNPEYSSFFREDSQMLVVFLSDEDVRSGEEFYNQENFDDYIPEYENDSPESVLKTFFEKFTYSAMKNIRFHSIIIPPGDKTCLEKQNENRKEHGRGYYGRVYARLSNPSSNLRQFLNDNNLPGNNFLDGSVISICDKNYGSQLKKVSISANEMKVPIPCSDPEDVQLFVNNREIREDIEYTTDETYMYFTPDGDLSLSSRVNMIVVCEGVDPCSD